MQIIAFEDGDESRRMREDRFVEGVNYRDRVEGRRDGDVVSIVASNVSIFSK